MSTASFPDGHIERLQNAALVEALSRAKDQIERGATKVVIYPEPHPPEGDGRRCTLCGGLRGDEKVHPGFPEPEERTDQPSPRRDSE